MKTRLCESSAHFGPVTEQDPTVRWSWLKTKGRKEEHMFRAFSWQTIFDILLSNGKVSQTTSYHNYKLDGARKLGYSQSQLISTYNDQNNKNQYCKTIRSVRYAVCDHGSSTE